MSSEPKNFTAKTAKIAKSRQSRPGGIRGAAGPKSPEPHLPSRDSALNMGSFFADFACFAVKLHCSG